MTFIDFFKVLIEYTITFINFLNILKIINRIHYDLYKLSNYTKILIKSAEHILWSSSKSLNNVNGNFLPKFLRWLKLEHRLSPDLFVCRETPGKRKVKFFISNRLFGELKLHSYLAGFSIMETLAGSILGKFFEELILNPAVNDLKKDDTLGKILKKVKTFLGIMRSTVIKIREGDRRIDDGEKLFINLFEEGDNLIGKYYRSHWLLRDRKFAGKIINFYESLTNFFQVYLPVQQFNRRNDISAPQQQQQQQQSDETEVSFSGDEIGNSDESEFTPFIVGMVRPLREVKKLLFEFKEEDDESSVIVVTAPGGCGKTTLAKQICQDPDVKGIHHTFFSLRVLSQIVF